MFGEFANEIDEFVNNVWDVLAGNKQFCTQEEFVEKYINQDCELDCQTRTITIGNYVININKK